MNGSHLRSSLGPSLALLLLGCRVEPLLVVELSARGLDCEGVEALHLAVSAGALDTLEPERRPLLVAAVPCREGLLGTVHIGLPGRLSAAPLRVVAALSTAPEVETRCFEGPTADPTGCVVARAAVPGGGASPGPLRVELSGECFNRRCDVATTCGADRQCLPVAGLLPCNAGSGCVPHGPDDSEAFAVKVVEHLPLDEVPLVGARVRVEDALGWADALTDGQGVARLWRHRPRGAPRRPVSVTAGKAGYGLVSVVGVTGGVPPVLRLDTDEGKALESLAVNTGAFFRELTWHVATWGHRARAPVPQATRGRFFMPVERWLWEALRLEPLVAGFSRSGGFWVERCEWPGLLEPGLPVNQTFGAASCDFFEELPRLQLVVSPPAGGLLVGLPVTLAAELLHEVPSVWPSRSAVVTSVQSTLPPEAFVAEPSSELFVVRVDGTLPANAFSLTASFPAATVTFRGGWDAVVPDAGVPGGGVPPASLPPFALPELAVLESTGATVATLAARGQVEGLDGGVFLALGLTPVPSGEALPARTKVWTVYTQPGAPPVVERMPTLPRGLSPRDVSPAGWVTVQPQLVVARPGRPEPWRWEQAASDPQDAALLVSGSRRALPWTAEWR